MNPHEIDDIRKRSRLAETVSSDVVHKLLAHVDAIQAYVIKLERLEVEVAAAVRELPDHVIVREDGADEDVAKSLAVSVVKVRARVAELEQLYGAACQRLQELGETKISLGVELGRRAARGRCEVHDDPLVLVWRCEEPANMNGAPRPVCPECLEERAEKAELALRKINDVRNSIVGVGNVNWSEHVYPLVSALDEAGFVGLGYPGALENFKTLVEQRDESEAACAEMRSMIEGLRTIAEVSTCVDLADAREVTLQELSDCGINPFAAKLISESFVAHDNPKPVTFRYGGAIFHMRPVKAVETNVGGSDA